MALPAVSSPATPSVNYDSLVENLRICSNNSYPNTGISNDGNRPLTDIIWSLVSLNPVNPNFTSNIQAAMLA